MNPLTNYIKERIEKNRWIEWVNWDDIVDELQAVLSKIEELEKKDNSKWSFLWFFRWEEMYYGNDVYKKYCAERELQELNK